MSILWVALSSLVSLLQFLHALNEMDGVCDSAACQNAAKIIASGYNPKVKPCDNFYQFACGNFMAGSEINGRTSRLGIVEYEIDKKIRSLLQEKPRRSETQILRSLKGFFQMCMDETKIDGRGAAPGLEMIKKLGGWPVLGGWDSAKWSFIETAIRSWQLGLDGFNLMEIGIDIDLVDKKYVFKVEQPNMLIPREYLIQGKDNSMVKVYFQYMVDMAKLFGAKSRAAELAMRKVLEFQIELAKVMVPYEKRRGFQSKLKKITLKELEEHPNKLLLNWRKLFEGIAQNKLQDDQKIHFYDLEVTQNILELINKYPAETIANHVMWNFAIKMSPYLTTKARNEHHRLQEALEGLNSRPSRWQACMVDVKEGFGVALYAFYVNNLFNKSSRKTATTITNLIKEEMDKVLLEADWMDENARQMAQQKSAKMLHVIGYPDELANLTKVEEYYKELNLNKEHYFEARMALKSFLIKDEVRYLNKVAGKRSWEMYLTDLTDATVRYYFDMNVIVASAGILQEPIVSASFPSYLNYASLGFAFGSQVTHAYDDLGRMFDSEGELNKWWNEATLKTFNEKKQCFIDQYSSFIESITKNKVNGINTQGANIADNGGLKLAYRAYRRVADQLTEPELRLPGLKQFNNNQLFFINFANQWCVTMAPETMKHDMSTGLHAPSEWRVNGAVMNMPQFGDLFGCGKGTPMNPEKTCQVW